MKHTITLLTALVILTGCITTDKARMICPQVETVAEVGTRRVVQANPQYRDGFAIAQIALEEASRDTTLDFSDLAAILDRLPVRELQDEDSKLIIDAGLLTIKLMFPDEPALDVSDYESAQIIAGCLAAGIKHGLQ